jgi:O-Antigen ligase
LSEQLRRLPTRRVVPRLPWWVKLLLAYLAGVTIIGKGPTYLGVPPLFWGEAVLALSLLLIAPWARGTQLLTRNRSITAVVVAFMALGAVLTALSFSRWRLDAIRDAAMWYYGLFYFVGLGLAARETIANRVWSCLRVFWMISLVWNTADLLSHYRLSHLGPIIPWRGVPFLFNSTHEAGQNLALGAMIVLCTATLQRKPILRTILVPIALLGLAVFAAAEGRGMRVGIASGVAAALLLCLSPRRAPHLSTRLLTLSVVAIPVLLLAIAINPDKIVAFAHVDRFADADPSNPTGTANWRIIWWQHLYAAVMKADPVFGLGFGESLHVYHPLLSAEHGVFEVRSPHNFNVTVFTRMGIAGLVLWVAILLIGLGTLFGRTWRGMAAGEPYTPDRREELTFWLMMLVATVVNSSFGVLMEGPVLGIWFWFALGFSSGRALSSGRQAAASPRERVTRLKRRFTYPATYAAAVR